MEKNPQADELNQITEDIIGAAIEVHRSRGPGLLEPAYEACLAIDMVERRHKLAQQKPLPPVYKGITLDCAYRLNLLVGDKVISE